MNINAGKNGEVRTEVKQEDKIIEDVNNEKKPETPRDKSKPISNTPVAGTPWYVVRFATFVEEHI